MTAADQPEELAVELIEEPEPEQRSCSVCHGAGAFTCTDGCHQRECDECEGSGRLWADDSPVPENEVRY
jgi:DnaJ-class molecular chaperone